ncbi:4'-phosphopantetheinyl transferase [uncultured Tateyamaria sp.]|uniref:4'-phosphopantetheinyl transferase family protein n=1 Tax=uncultured Tateyamaria sp. TaxID=455651 RepID=UPI002609238E|nr:4'-phosphopantetheinyl transferase superfamily protein [uncultured Tateyamaria sp.]
MSALDALCQQLQGYVGPSVGIGVADPKGLANGLDPVEAVATTRMIDKRLREFAAGRAAARRAMQAIDWPPMPVPMRPDRSPCWPAGVEGSISHCNSAAIAVVARSGTIRALGVDMEEAEPLDTDLWDTVLTPDERDRTDNGLTAKRIFCAKEAVYKAQFPITGQLLGFEDVVVTLKGTQFTARIKSGGDDWSGIIVGSKILPKELIISIVTLH